MLKKMAQSKPFFHMREIRIKIQIQIHAYLIQNNIRNHMFLLKDSNPEQLHSHSHIKNILAH